MKSGGGGGGGGGGYQGGKRRWKFLAVGVLFLVVLSMLVPLVFLLGIHNGFHSTSSATTAFLSDHPSSGAINNNVRIEKKYNGTISLDRSEEEESTDLDELPRPAERTISKDVPVSNADERKPDALDAGSSQYNQPTKVTDTPVTRATIRQPIASKNHDTRSAAVNDVIGHVKRAIGESQKQCEMRYGSYCLWREENKEDMKDSMVKKMKDQLFVARSYFPTVAKLPAESKLSREMKLNIQEFERVLSECTTDRDLPPQIEKKVEKMGAVIDRAKTVPHDCNNVDKKLRQILDMTEDEANFHMKQSVFLYQLAVKTKPKSLHCLSMKLTVEYFKSPSPDSDLSPSKKHLHSSARHFVIFSNNMLASSVAINSTVMTAKDSKNLVFHVLTDKQNYFGIKLWFSRHKYEEAAVDVLNVEDFNVEYQDMPAMQNVYLPLEFRVSQHTTDTSSSGTEYLSVFSPAHYLLPRIFPTLERVVVLDDDVVVQRDLTSLWSINMGGKVNGAVQICSVQLRHLKSYLGGTNFNKSSCAWMSGLNVIDLTRWKELDLTGAFRKSAQQLQKGAREPEGIALGASLLTFQDLIYPLDDFWALPGLGHNYGLDVRAIKNAAVLHYNGNMKPWLELGIPNYKPYWKRFLNRDDRFLGECNVNT